MQTFNKCMLDIRMYFMLYIIINITLLANFRLHARVWGVSRLQRQELH